MAHRVLFVAFVVITMTFFGNSFTAFSLTKHPVVACLGAEELQLHKLKQTNALFKLNQNLQLDFVNLSNIPMALSLANKICHDKSPSLNLLYFTLIQQYNLFDKDYISSKNTKMIKDFIIKTQSFFIEYLGLVQVEFENANCYREKYPKIYEFITSYKMMSPDEQNNRNIWRKSKIRGILEYFKDSDKMIENCKLPMKK